MAGADSLVFHTRTLGTPAEGVKDQYADGKAAKIWEVYIGDKTSRTKNYKNFLVGMLKEKGCRRILDVACGTGVDSIMLLEEGFQVVSVDASDKMLKHALKTRWTNRKLPAYDNWIIEEANWLTLYDDIKDLVGDGFDAVICLGNSFAHLIDTYGDQRQIKQAICNFQRCVKPGGFLLIDHRNYDYILDYGQTPSKSIYYNSKHTTDIKTSVIFVSGKPTLVICDYYIDCYDYLNKDDDDNTIKKEVFQDGTICEFRLSYYPHRLESFADTLKSIFGETTTHTVYGDFKHLEDIQHPSFYIHYIEKPPGYMMRS